MSAIISPCGKFRLRLDRDLEQDGPVVAIGGVNPSTANAIMNDATIRKDMGFGRRLGWGRIIKFNKFAYRATDVRELAHASDPIGPGNDAIIEEIMREADIVIMAYGPLAKLPKRLRTRWKAVAQIADRLSKTLYCFGTARDGHPLHTLMLGYDTPLQPWRRPEL